MHAAATQNAKSVAPTNTHRLELEDAPSRARPSALRLHTAAGFTQQRGYPPAAHPTFLALAGKKAAGVAGTGLSERSAKRLAARWVILLIHAGRRLLEQVHLGALATNKVCQAPAGFALQPHCAGVAGPGLSERSAKRLAARWAAAAGIDALTY